MEITFEFAKWKAKRLREKVNSYHPSMTEVINETRGEFFVWNNPDAT